MPGKKMPIFNFELCVSCSICAQHCPVSAIELSCRRDNKDTNLYPVVDTSCIGCGSCERMCPTYAVSMTYRLI